MPEVLVKVMIVKTFLKTKTSFIKQLYFNDIEILGSLKKFIQKKKFINRKVYYFLKTVKL